MTYSGLMLVASPNLADSSFKESLVLLFHETEQEIFGLIVNRVTPKTIKTLWKTTFDRDSDRTDPIYFGGPVLGPLFVLYQEAVPKPDEPESPICVSTDRDFIESAVDRDLPFKVLLGNAVWTQKQLAQEIDQGYWYLLPTSNTFVFHKDVTNAWTLALQIVSDMQLAKMLDLETFPTNPLNN